MNGLNKGEEVVLNLLKARAVGGSLKLHTKEVERNLVSDGTYSLSVSRYMRGLRIKGKIDYPDPRSNKHFYLIKIIEESKGGQYTLI